MTAWVPLADVDGDGCVCDEYGPAFCDWGGDHLEPDPSSEHRSAA